MGSQARRTASFLALRALSFLAVPCGYFLLGLLNYSQAGKTAALGVPALLAVAAWRAGRPASPGGGGTWPETLVAAPFVFILAFQAFLRGYFGVAHDDEIVMEAIFGTDGGEVGEFFLHNGRAIGKHVALLALFLLLHGLLLRLGNRYLPAAGGEEGAGEGARRPSFLPYFFLAVFLLLHLNPTMRRTDPLLYFPLRYKAWNRNVEETRRVQERLAATASDPELASLRYEGKGPRTVVFVLGESQARHNWSLYGYPRQTNPELAALGKELVAFGDVLTGYAGTSGSLRLLFTPADISRPNLWKTKPDIVTMAKKAGYKTFWLSNHGGRTGIVSVIASHADETGFFNRGGARGEGSYDGVLLDPFRKALSDPAPRKFIILHMLGGHPAFHFRYPKEFARFDGVADGVRREMGERGRAPWVIRQRDEYDDAMLYADHLLRRTIEMCRERKGEAIAWLFTPDHGEDVGHYTDFVGHNHRVRSMWEVPFLFWRSEAFPAGEVAPEAAARRPGQTDRLDHTLLGLLAVRGSFYDPRFDLLSPRFEPVKRFVGEGAPYP